MFRFLRLREEHLPLVLRWRTNPEVTKFMYTDFTPDMTAQKDWYHRLSAAGSLPRYWIIQFDGRPIGLINIADLDMEARRSSYGFYIGELDAWNLGGLVPPYFYNHVFSDRTLNLHKITAEVLFDNINVKRMLLLYGFREIGIFKDHVIKHGRFHDVMLFELLKTDWLKQTKKFGHYLASFE